MPFAPRKETGFPRVSAARHDRHRLRAARPRSAVTSSNARIVARPASPTIVAATGTVQSARDSRGSNGSPTVAPNCCRLPISTLSSPCPRRSRRSLSRTRPSSTMFSSRRRRDGSRHWRRRQAPRRTDRHDCRPAHMGTDPQTSSARPLHRAWRRARSRRALGRLQAGLLSPRSRSLAFISAPVSRTFANGVRRGDPDSFSAIGRPCENAPHLLRISHPLSDIAWVVYAKRPFARPTPGSRLPRPLHASCRHRQRTPRRLR